jgi:hypothetical protein
VAAEEAASLMLAAPAVRSAEESPALGAMLFMGSAIAARAVVLDPPPLGLLVAEPARNLVAGAFEEATPTAAVSACARIVALPAEAVVVARAAIALVVAEALVVRAVVAIISHIVSPQKTDPRRMGW